MINYMRNMIGILPIISVVAIFLIRMVELGKKRQTIPGPVKENLTFRLFVLVGALMLVASVVEYFLLRAQRSSGRRSWPAGSAPSPRSSFAVAPLPPWDSSGACMWKFVRIMNLSRAGRSPACGIQPIFR